MANCNGDKKNNEGQDFAPNTDNDHRPVGQWQTRYTRIAYLQISVETLYVLLVFVVALAGLIFLKYLSLPPSDFKIPYSTFLTYRKAGFAIMGGLLGGVLFDMKWLYHSVAHGIWNQDRVLWRFLTPLISCGLAFAFYIIIKSGILTIINSSSADKPSSIVAISFLVGYFSDSALAKMYEVATTLFGTVSRDGKKPESPPKDKGEQE